MPDGAKALGDLASRLLGTPANYVLLDLETSPIEDGVANRSILVGPNLQAQRTAVTEATEPVLTIGGDCGVEFEPIRHAVEKYGTGLAVAWFDAHPDLNTPKSSLTGAFHAMVLRGLMGEGDPALTADPALKPDHVALIGARAADAAEQAAIADGWGILTGDPATQLRGAEHLYVHVDVDVLDPSEFGGLNMPEADGMTIEELVEGLDSLKDFNIIGAGITECVGSPEQVEVLAPVIEKLGELMHVDNRQQATL